MADKTSDAVDRLLASALKAEPIADDGFSARIVSRIRRRIWVNRLALPIAVLVRNRECAYAISATGAVDRFGRDGICGGHNAAQDPGRNLTGG
jgi:hypothetical protein